LGFWVSDGFLFDRIYSYYAVVGGGYGDQSKVGIFTSLYGYGPTAKEWHVGCGDIPQRINY
jgi:hypothetical protein